ncbi:hypothetical protein IWX49DRAFT_56691 [Phyllosticta citricarpa]
MTETISMSSCTERRRVFQRRSVFLYSSTRRRPSWCSVCTCGSQSKSDLRTHPTTTTTMASSLYEQTWDEDPAGHWEQERSRSRSESPVDNKALCCDQYTPVAVEWRKTANDKKAAATFGHRLPTATGKGVIDMYCGDHHSDDAGAHQRPAYIKLRTPLHLDGYTVGQSGERVDLFLFFGGETLVSMDLTLYTSLDVNGSTCSTHGCDCKAQLPAEGTDIAVRRLITLPALASRAFLHAQSFWGMRTRDGVGNHDEGGHDWDEWGDSFLYKGDVVQIDVTLKRPPLLIAPNGGAMPTPSTQASRKLLAALCGIAETATSLTLYIPRKYVASLRHLTRFRDALATEEALTTPGADAAFDLFYRCGWSYFRDRRAYRPDEEMLVGGVVDIGEDGEGRGKPSTTAPSQEARGKRARSYNGMFAGLASRLSDSSGSESGGYSGPSDDRWETQRKKQRTE